ncbi:hypothetical protein RFN29_11955 [Mesorhizobium sp. VK22B]|uniref:Uncharacterized protein n=1 Tax=Mesorhizobium captivum TaxID=3072319 RepID=A0ABU4YZ89_9HYPH|nr:MULTISPECIES: hypothetical protein [unclassified Mesorhizobium]MDX8492296.1 hypothetical protein [Mesorhizobium sp. VK22B]MDX8506239.1 hypothetical protein [Mesorhizobium sp. VK22E]
MTEPVLCEIRDRMAPTADPDEARRASLALDRAAGQGATSR